MIIYKSVYRIQVKNMLEGNRGSISFLDNENKGHNDNMYSQRMQVRFRDVKTLMFRQIYPNSIIFVWRPSKWHTFIQLILKSPGHRNWVSFFFYLKNVINGRIAWQWLIKWRIIIKMENCLPWLLSWWHIWNIKFETSYKEGLVLNYHAIVQSCTERKSLT